MQPEITRHGSKLYMYTKFPWRVLKRTSRVSLQKPQVLRGADRADVSSGWLEPRQWYPVRQGPASLNQVDSSELLKHTTPVRVVTISPSRLEWNKPLESPSQKSCQALLIIILESFHVPRLSISSSLCGLLPGWADSLSTEPPMP
ncbi:hypothetical protein PoB_005294600 [Plakobranchus ocellatus]|uniref:Uncharacterized protein n=1 Tax=Plakobranchus ocellatus TaxID=259542 RepID=A0AAV4BTC3_9GAST|nr:hypothetical protein PoB_005294600 [Plakobranchus ocellatus]